MTTAMAGDDFVKMGAVGVGNEDLAETVAGDHIDDALNTAGVEFVKDIVKQQDGHCGVVGLEEVELGKPQGYGIGLALPLTASAAHGIVIEHQLDIVAMHAARGVTDDEVALAGCRQMFCH